MERGEILDWLHETDTARLAELWRLADRTREMHVGGEVHLRGLVEWSNRCVRRCAYCGLRADHCGLDRYCMSDEEVLACARKAVQYGYGTIVIQSGEDPELRCERVARLVERIKAETPLAITLSLGERDEAELAAWRRAGADRYLLRFETSNTELFERIHPPKAGATPDAKRHGRLTLLGQLRRLGYEVGGGVMIGIPGQTYDDLADDIEWFARLDLDMIGMGPYLPHPATPMADRRAWPDAPVDRQAPASEEMTYKMIALTRLACPHANIPATTALATLSGRHGWELGLMRGANVVMPNLTPPQYRDRYEIYPNKANLLETYKLGPHDLLDCIEAIGRRLGRGRGDSPNYTMRRMAGGAPVSAGADGCLA